MTYEIVHEVNKQSPGNYDVFVIEGEQKILAPCTDHNTATILELEEVDKFFIKYSTCKTEITKFTEDVILIDETFYIMNDFPITPFSIVECLGERYEAEAEYDNALSKGYGWSSYNARNSIIRNGCYVINIHPEDLRNYQIKTKEDLLKDHPGFNIQRYLQFWDKWDASWNKFQKENPKWYED